MQNTQRNIIIYIIVLTLCVMYATQPLQPLLANEFDVSIVSASYFTAIIMFFLAIAPIVYGYIIEHISSKKLLQIALIVLFITNIFLTFSTNFEFFSFARTIEAIVIPALLTTSMAILASDKQNIKQNMSIYVAATVFGGLFGRVVSGFVADIFGWRTVFIMLSISMLIGIYLLQKLEFEGETNLIKAKVNDIVKIVKQRQFLLIYILMFTMFYTFGGLLNLLPFYMKDIIQDINETQIGLLYLGYGVGIVVALKINTIISWFKRPISTLMIGLLIFITSTSLFIFENYYLILLMVFPFCMGMFIVHTISTRIANSLQESQKGITSGLYLSFYYIGGTVGSILPAIIYQNFGWNVTLASFAMILLISLVIIFLNKKLYYKV